MIKLTSVLLATGISFVSASAFAGQQLVEMSDTEMDKVAAGSLLSVNNVGNNANVLSNNQVAVNVGDGDISQHQYVKQVNSNYQHYKTHNHSYTK